MLAGRHSTSRVTYVRTLVCARMLVGTRAVILCTLCYVHSLIGILPAPRLCFICHLILRSYAYIIHAEGLLPDGLCLVTLLSSEQYSQFERFRPQHVQMVNKTFNFKTNSFGNNK